MITRRIFLRVIAASTAASAFPNVLACGSSPAPPTPITAPPGSFFTDAEWRALNALADAVIPPDIPSIGGATSWVPGGAALGAATYIDTLMRAFDSDPPLIHAGGPFSGRAPFANPTGGTASTNFPANDFKNFLPLSRVADRGWRLRIFGSSGVTGGGPNDAVTGPVVGLRDMMKKGLSEAMAASPGGPVESLDPNELQTLLGSLAGSDADFVRAFAELVAEAALAAPEYGGNGELAGWNMVHIDGDVQPLGYSIFDGAANAYVERLPVSTADTAPDVDTIDDDIDALLTTYTNILNGRVAP